MMYTEFECVRGEGLNKEMKKREQQKDASSQDSLGGFVRAYQHGHESRKELGARRHRHSPFATYVRWGLMGSGVFLLFIGISFPFISKLFQRELPLIQLIATTKEGIDGARLAGVDKKGNYYRLFSDQVTPQGGNFLLSVPSLTVTNTQKTYLQIQASEGIYSPGESSLFFKGSGTVFYSQRNVRLTTQEFQFDLGSQVLKSSTVAHIETDFMEAHAQNGIQASADEATLFGPLSVSFKQSRRGKMPTKETF